MKRYVAEFVGTLLLITIAVGSAIAGITSAGVTGVALTFGITLLALAYAIGPVSGCHLNPAVTLGALIAKRIAPVEAAKYVVAQVAGGIAGAGLLKWMVSMGRVTDQTGGLGSNDYGKSITGPGAFLVEIIITFLLVFVVLMVTEKVAVRGFDGLAIGLALGAANLFAIPLDGASVNPARSIGPALFNGGSSLTHLWLFIVAPLVGGALAALVHRITRVEAGHNAAG